MAIRSNVGRRGVPFRPFVGFPSPMSCAHSQALSLVILKAPQSLHPKFPQQREAPPSVRIVMGIRILRDVEALKHTGLINQLLH